MSEPKFYVQYNGETGAIGALVSSVTAPVFDHQLTFDDYPNIVGKMVDLETLTLVDAPPVEGGEE